MFKKFRTVACFALFLALSAPALADKAQDTLKGLSARYQGLNAIAASYSRTTTTPSSEQLFKSGSSQTALGRLSWAKPAKLLLDQKSPQPELMVTDGRSVWWHIPAEKLVYVYKDINVAGQIRPLLAFLDGLDQLGREFKFKDAPADKGRPGLRGLILTPKKSDELGLDKLTVWCDNDFKLTGFRITAVTGEVSDFYLSGLEENPKLDDKIFTFKAPKGTQVVEEQGQ